MGEGVATCRAVDQLHSFALASEHHGMFAYDATPSHRMHANFFGGSFADDSLPAVTNCAVIRRRSDLGKDLTDPFSRPARRVLFVPMVHLNYFGIECFTEDLCRFAT